MVSVPERGFAPGRQSTVDSRQRSFFGHLALASVVTLAAAGCGDDDCGPGDVPAIGLFVDTGASQLSYGDGTSSPNNDCPTAGSPTSLTVDVFQVDPAPAQERSLVLCLPRPEALGDAPVDIADDTQVLVIDVFADEDDCLISIDRSRQVSGTATFTGFCENGTDPAGYALGIDAEIPAIRSCPGGDEPIDLAVSGEVALEALQL
jgi:hypothetical protein